MYSVYPTLSYDTNFIKNNATLTIYLIVNKDRSKTGTKPTTLTVCINSVLNDIFIANDNMLLNLNVISRTYNKLQPLVVFFVVCVWCVFKKKIKKQKKQKKVRIKLHYKQTVIHRCQYAQLHQGQGMR